MYHEIVSFPAKIAAYAAKYGMIAPGDRVGVAVSGGADSVALLRALLKLRAELGCVLVVAHFNHGIRPEARGEAEFVTRLAKKFRLEFLGGEGDARKFARERKVSLETAARELRYGWFSSQKADKIATAHTLDDQAETVLMKLLRGAGTKGMSGIWPVKQYPVPRAQYPEKDRKQEAGSGRQENPDPSTPRARARSARDDHFMVIRPMLGVRRREVEEYLRSLEQDWCEDATNRDVKHTRNKIRHELLPLLEQEYNPNIYRQLADAAEVARGEEEFWEQYPVLGTQYPENADPSIAPSSAGADSGSLGMTSGNGRREVGGRRQEERAHEDVRAHIDPNGSKTRHAAALRGGVSLHLDTLAEQPLAVRRRVVREGFKRASGKSLDFEHTDELVRFLERRKSGRLQLPDRWFAVLDWPQRRLRFEVGTASSGKTSKTSGKQRPRRGPSTRAKAARSG